MSQLTTSRIGISRDFEQPGEAFYALDLHVTATEIHPRSWYRTPLRGLAVPGSARVGGAGVIWGPVLLPGQYEALTELIRAAPERAVIVITDGPCPGDPVDLRVTWLQVNNEPLLVEVVSGVESVEIAVSGLAP